MKVQTLLLGFFTASLLAACSASPDSATGQADSKLACAPDACGDKKDVKACLAESGCAWGDSGHGAECFFIGTVVPESISEPTPCPTDPKPPVTTKKCVDQKDVESCLNVGTCAWDKSHEQGVCFEIGVIVPE